MNVSDLVEFEFRKIKAKVGLVFLSLKMLRSTVVSWSSMYIHSMMVKSFEIKGTAGTRAVDLLPLINKARRPSIHSKRTCPSCIGLNEGEGKVER